MCWRLPPRSDWFLRCWSLFSSIFWDGFITFGIKALDSRVSLLQTGHRGIFSINFCLRRFISLNFYIAKPKSWGTTCKKFKSWFTIIIEICSVEFRDFSSSRISPKTGHRGIFAITFFLRRWRSWNYYREKP